MRGVSWILGNSSPAGGVASRGGGGGERAFEIGDRLGLHPPEAGRVERRKLRETGPKLVLAELGEADKLLGAVEGQDVAAARLGVEAAGELRDFASGFVGEGERQEPMGQAVGVPSARLATAQNCVGR